MRDRRLVLTISLRTDGVRDARQLEPLLASIVAAIQPLLAAQGWTAIMDANLSATSKKAIDKRFAQDDLATEVRGRTPSRGRMTKL